MIVEYQDKMFYTDGILDEPEKGFECFECSAFIDYVILPNGKRVEDYEEAMDILDELYPHTLATFRCEDCAKEE